MKANHIQYTVRDVPKSIDVVLRKKAKEQNKSLNAFIVDSLIAQVGSAAPAQIHHDLDHLIGTWVGDDATDRALRAQRRVDARDWE